MIEKIKSTLSSPEFQKAAIRTVTTIVVAIAINVVVNAATAAIGNGIQAWKDRNDEIPAE